MSNVTIYHNPRCSKSRQALSLLNERGIEPAIVEYLKNPPDAKALGEITRLLGVSAKELIRDKEFKDLGLPETDDEGELLELMAQHPQIIQRPIVVAKDKAAIGRPPENVLAIL